MSHDHHVTPFVVAYTSVCRKQAKLQGQFKQIVRSARKGSTLGMKKAARLRKGRRHWMSDNLNSYMLIHVTAFVFMSMEIIQMNPLSACSVTHTHTDRHPDRPGKECSSSLTQVRLLCHVCFWGQGSQRRERAALVDGAPWKRLDLQVHGLYVYVCHSAHKWKHTTYAPVAPCNQSVNHWISECPHLKVLGPRRSIVALVQMVHAIKQEELVHMYSWMTKPSLHSLM